MPRPSLLFVREPPKPAARVLGNPGALSPLDVGHYAYRGEITESTGVSLTLTQPEDFVFSLSPPACAGGVFLFTVTFLRRGAYYRIKCKIVSFYKKSAIKGAFTIDFYKYLIYNIYVKIFILEDFYQ